MCGISSKRNFKLLGFGIVIQPSRELQYKATEASTNSSAEAGYL